MTGTFHTLVADIGAAAKKLVVLGAAVLVLASCIDVDDFGEAWSKGFIDPALAGRWVKLDENTEQPTNQQWLFTVKEDSYQVESFVDGKRDEDGPLYPVKTIGAGPYRFLASGPEQGSILRYTVEDDAIVWYVLNPKHAMDFIRKTFPDNTQFYVEKADDETADAAKADAKSDDSQVLRIHQFDDSVFKILSQIPNTEFYWEADTAIEKVP